MKMYTDTCNSFENENKIMLAAKMCVLCMSIDYNNLTTIL